MSFKNVMPIHEVHVEMVRLDKWKLWPAGGASLKVRESPNSVGFIIWRPWKSAWIFMPTYPTVADISVWNKALDRQIYIAICSNRLREAGRDWLTGKGLIVLLQHTSLVQIRLRTNLSDSLQFADLNTLPQFNHGDVKGQKKPWFTWTKEVLMDRVVIIHPSIFFLLPISITLSIELNKTTASGRVSLPVSLHRSTSTDGGAMDG